MFASITVNFERSFCRNYFLCERSQKDDTKDEDAGGVMGVYVRGS